MFQSCHQFRHNIRFVIMINQKAILRYASDSKADTSASEFYHLTDMFNLRRHRVVVTEYVIA